MAMLPEGGAFGAHPRRSDAAATMPPSPYPGWVYQALRAARLPARVARQGLRLGPRQSERRWVEGRADLGLEPGDATGGNL